MHVLSQFFRSSQIAKAIGQSYRRCFMFSVIWHSLQRLLSLRWNWCIFLLVILVRCTTWKWKKIVLASNLQTFAKVKMNSQSSFPVRFSSSDHFCWPTGMFSLFVTSQILQIIEVLFCTFSWNWSVEVQSYLDLWDGVLNGRSSSWECLSKWQNIQSA